eukprot:CAMPEP_0177637950 /NCGR_PEP_ID=MMETSP0447-20121125/5236_1 /TAXON_ID=0 /ORGANISM="Stygamoeba regulata, Strain BSH-02190019" /LENGTH=48 /DNA_ID= /DNA_START= /DNA_END= /DNA_ORIENTATION=
MSEWLKLRQRVWDDGCWTPDTTTGETDSLPAADDSFLQRGAHPIDRLH